MMFLTNCQPLHRSLQVLLLLVFLTNSPAWGQSWADAPADLTVGEYLQLVFRLDMKRPDTKALNDFSLVNFYSSSDPQMALVLVIQTWRDERVLGHYLPGEIRSVGEAFTAQFEAMARRQDVLKRWNMNNPKENFVVRHVRLSDLRETLAVTVNGETLFDDKDISKAKAYVTSRGGIWSL